MNSGFDDQQLRGMKAGIELAKILGDKRFPREATSACLLSGLTGNRVAVMGVVKRGKSTLVNRLIGKKMSPVDMLPETASLLAFQNSGSNRPRAVGITPSGEVISLPVEAAEFRETVKRGSRVGVAAASVSGEFTLPPRIWLLDTPGSSEALVDDAIDIDVGVADCVFRLCQKFLLVIGVPGYSDTDVKLVNEVISKVGKSKVTVVVKNLDSSINPDSLRRIATAGLPNFDVETLAIADNETAAIDKLQRSIEGLAKSDDLNAARGVDATRGILEDEFRRLGELATARMRTSDIEIPQKVYNNLPAALYAIVRDNLPAEKRARAADAQRRAQMEAENRKKRERDAARHAMNAWTEKKRELETVVKSRQSELNEAQRAVDKNASPVGCLYWTSLGFFGFLSLAAFPIGPIIIGVIAFIIYSSAEGDSANARTTLSANLESRRNSLSIAAQELNLHLKKKPS